MIRSKSAHWQHSLRVLLTIALPMSFFAQSTAGIRPIPADGNIYVDTEIGKATNDGSKANPLNSINEAAKRITGAEGDGSITVYLSAGLSETVDFNPSKWKFSNSQRLIVRSSMLPDDPSWTPVDMPVIISTLPFSVEKDNNGLDI